MTAERIPSEPAEFADLFRQPAPLPSAFAIREAHAKLEAAGAYADLDTPEQRADLAIDVATWAAGNGVASADTVPASCTTTVADLDVTPAREMLAGIIAPLGITMLYGRGGTGKGVETTYLIGLLVREGHRVYVLDYENHPDEWAERLRAFGMADDDLRCVAYRTPYGDHWPEDVRRGPLVGVADYVREDAAAFDATVIVCDSFTTATSTGDANGGADAAQEFASAASRISAPMLVLAHVPKAAERFPAYPFGSVFAHNLSRATWAVEAQPADDRDPANPYAPALVRLELRNQKRNRGAKAAPVFVTFAFYARADGTLERIEADAGQDNSPTVAEMAEAVLEEPMTVAELRRAIRDDYGRDVSEDAVRKALSRSARLVEQRTGKRPYRWARQ